MISRADAIKLVKNSRKYPHLLVASTIMRKLAERLGEDSLEWELVGWLHDLDVEETRYDKSKHGILAAKRLRGKLPDHCLYAIKAHDFRTGFKPADKLGKALRAVDSMYYILAKELRMSFEQLDAEGLKGELERISLKRPWHRDNILGCEDVGLSLEDLLRLSMDAFNESSESKTRRTQGTHKNQVEPFLNAHPFSLGKNSIERLRSLFIHADLQANEDILSRSNALERSVPAYFSG